MALVTTEAAAVVFRTGNDQFEIYFRRNRTLQGLPEAGPTGAAVELRLRREQRLIATGAVIRAAALFGVQRTGEGTLSAFVAEHVIGLG